MAHLKYKSTTGHLLRNAAGHLVYDCTGNDYIQAIRCSDLVAVNLWAPIATLPSNPYTVQIFGVCYEFSGAATSDDPTGKRMLETVPYTEVASCADASCVAPLFSQARDCCTNTLQDMWFDQALELGNSLDTKFFKDGAIWYYVQGGQNAALPVGATEYSTIAWETECCNNGAGDVPPGGNDCSCIPDSLVVSVTGYADTGAAAACQCDDAGQSLNCAALMNRSFNLYRYTDDADACQWLSYDDVYEYGGGSGTQIMVTLQRDTHPDTGNPCWSLILYSYGCDQERAAAPFGDVVYLYLENGCEGEPMGDYTPASVNGTPARCCTDSNPAASVDVSAP